MRDVGRLREAVDLMTPEELNRLRFLQALMGQNPRHLA